MSVKPETRQQASGAFWAILVVVIASAIGWGFTTWNDENAYDGEVDVLKRVIEPVVKSTQSLAIDRKAAQLDRKLKTLATIEETPADKQTATQKILKKELIESSTELDAEIKDLKTQYALPIFEEAK